uniref:Sulfatase N-terminal domain-containing protein n=1 Tax=Oncorhynchus tshawytscha TaxID=74940 RepID=A0A8C8I1B7_ONCTS
MVDDLAIVDSGNTTLTPNIDMLAQEGLRLTRHIAAAPLCTPSRAGVYIISAASGGLPKEEVTFAKVAKRQGYETVLSFVTIQASLGKWHRGLNCERNDDYCHHPSAHGFHHFYGITLTKLRDCQPGRSSIFTNVQAHTPFKYIFSTLPYKTLGVGVATVTFLHARGVVTAWRKLVLRVVAIYGTFVANFPDFSCFLMRNREVDEQPYVSENLTQRMTDEVNSAPFLLFFSFIQVHTAMFASPAFQGTSQHDIYGNAIQEVDWSVDLIGFDLLCPNTLVYLTSDQLAHLEEITVRGEVHRGWNGIQVPVLLRWTGMLPAGKDIDEPTSNVDIFPAVVKLAGGTALGDRVIDGHDLIPLLQGKVERSKQEFLFHYCNAYLNVVRWQPPNSYSKWKLFFFTPDFYPENGTACMHTHACFCTASYVTYHDPPLLFDLSYTEPAFHSVVEEIRVAVAVHKESITPVQDQLAPGHLLWKPCLQPCCSSLSQKSERDKRQRKYPHFNWTCW